MTENFIAYKVDDKIEANYKNLGKYYTGTIASINKNGDIVSYDIAYDDGESESNVNNNMIRYYINNCTTTFVMGERIEANYKSRGKFYPGKIKNVNNDKNTYDIAYDDGEIENNVSNCLIKSLIQTFPSWDLSGQNGPLVINGISIDSILSKIAEQIAILKERSNESNVIMNKLDTYEKTINNMTLDIQALKDKIDKYPNKTEMIPLPNSEILDKQFNDMNQKQSEIINKLESHEKIHAQAKDEYAQKNKKIEQLEDIVQKLSIKIQNNEKTIEANKSQYVKELKESSESFSIKIDNLMIKIGEHSEKIIELESIIANNNDTKFEIYDKKMSEMDSKLNIITESNRTVEGRVKQFETFNNQILEQVATAKENIESLGARMEFEITDRINKLERDKSDRTEMVMKADISLLATKSDFSEITRIDEIIQELNRRLMAQRKEALENMTSLQKDFTNRSENIAAWCLKQLRKEMKKDKNDGADIGKVRCLVCDQVVEQHTDTDIVHTRERELHSNMKIHKMTNAQQQAIKDHSNNRPASAGLSREYSPNPEIKKKSSLKPLRDISPSNDERARSASPSSRKKSPEGSRTDKLPNLKDDVNIVSISGNVNFVSGNREYLGITQLQFSQSASYFKDLETRITGGNKNKMLAGNRPMSAGNPYRKK